MPLPWNVVATGSPSDSEKATSASFAPARGPVPGKHYGLLCRGEDLGGPGDLRGRRILGADHVHGKRSEVASGGRFHILRDYEVSRPRPLSLGALERLANHLGNRLWAKYVIGPFGHGVEHEDEVDTLMRLLVDPVQPDLSREGDQGRAVRGGVGGPEEEVDRPRPERRRAYPGLSRQTAVDLGHERRGLLVADEDVPDLRAVQRVHQVYILLTWDAEDVLYTFVLKTTHDQLRSRLLRGISHLGHEVSPFKSTFQNYLASESYCTQAIVAAGCGESVVRSCVAGILPLARLPRTP